MEEELAPELVIEYWKQAIQTQMHFNDLCVRSRQLGLTFVVAALGLNVVLLSEYPTAVIPILGFEIHIASIIAMIAAFAVLAVWHLDLGVYHKMLRGSVAFVEELDQGVLVPKIPNLEHGMTKFISEYSRHPKTKYENGQFSNSGTRIAGDKVRFFYFSIFVSLIVISLLLGFIA